MDQIKEVVINKDLRKGDVLDQLNTQFEEEMTLKKKEGERLSAKVIEEQEKELKNRVYAKQLDLAFRGAHEQMEE